MDCVEFNLEDADLKAISSLNINLRVSLVAILVPGSAQLTIVLLAQ